MTESGLKNINVFIQRLQTFFYHFLRFLTFLIFFWNVFFTSMIICDCDCTVLNISIYLLNENIRTL